MLIYKRFCKIPTQELNCSIMPSRHLQFCYCKWNWKSLTRVRLFATPWTIQSVEFSRPEYWTGSLSLLQGIFPTQRSNPGLPHCRWILYQLSHSWLVFIKYSFYLPPQIYGILVNSTWKLLYQVVPTQWWVCPCRPTSPSTLFVARCINLCRLLNGSLWFAFPWSLRCLTIFSYT